MSVMFDFLTKAYLFFFFKCNCIKIKHIAWLHKNKNPLSPNSLMVLVHTMTSRGQCEAEYECNFMLALLKTVMKQ